MNTQKKSIAATLFLLGLAAPAIADSLTQQRTKFDASFRQQLDKLAADCEAEGLDPQARLTRSWFIIRHPDRQYLCLPTSSDPLAATDPVAAEVRQWYGRLSEIRHAQATRLWELVDQALQEGELELAFQTIHEILRENPADERAARLVWGHTGQQFDHIRVQVGRKRERSYGWSAGSYWRVHSAHFQVLTNHSQKAGVELIESLEELYGVWRQLFVRHWTGITTLRQAVAGRSLPATSRKRHKVVLFADRAEYRETLRPLEPQVDMTLGMYRDAARASYFFVDETRQVATWRHEVTHQLFQESVAADRDVGANRDFWIVEGVALYMESARRFHGYYTVGGLESERLQIARYRRLHEGFYVPLSELLAMGKNALQLDDRIRRIYTQSAGFAHFLMDYQKGRYRQALAEYIREVYRRRDAARSLVELTGTPPERLDHQYQDFLQVNDQQLEGLPDASRIKSLSLGHTQVTDAGLAYLKNAAGLHWLDLTACDVTDEGLERLSPLAPLVQLSLEQTHVTDQGLQWVGKHLQTEELDLSGTAVTNAGMSHLEGMTGLRHLWLNQTEVTEDGVEVLRKLPKLESIQLDSGGAATANRDPGDRRPQRAHR